MTDSLKMIRFVLDKRGLARIAARHRLPRGIDEGYLIHAGLAQLFATSSEATQVPLHSFTVDDTNPRAVREPHLLFMLAYSNLDEGALLAAMGTHRKDLVVECASTEMPELEAGTRAAFRVRACPVVRSKLPGVGEDATNATGRRRSREVDAWLAERLRDWRPDPPSGPSLERQGNEWLSRQDVYLRWLGNELERFGAARLEDGARLESYVRQRMYRRGGRGLQRPDVVLCGSLEVGDAGGFQKLLRRGLGRHRAFGFGMLLLSRPQARSC